MAAFHPQRTSGASALRTDVYDRSRPIADSRNVGPPFDLQEMRNQASAMNLAKENPKTVAGLAFLCAAIFIGIAAIACLHAIYISHVSERQRESQATIEALDPYGHGRVYSYKFNTTESGAYYGSSEISTGGPYSIGQVVTAYYDPKHPSTNSLARFSKNVLGDEIFPFAPLCLAGIAMAYGCIMWRRTPVLT